MKLFLFCLSVAVLAPFPAADPLDELIPAYEAYVREASPDEAAREEGRSPARWGDLRPESIAAEAEKARALLADIEAAETDRDIDKAILIRLLQGDLMGADFDTARIPFTGDWGFQAEPIFAALRMKVTNVESGEAWAARLNDVPRYFAEKGS